MLHTKQGFTLIELLTVVLIIGVLTSIAVPQYTKSVRRAEMTEGLTQGKTIYDAAVRYWDTNGEKPTSFDVLDIAFVDAGPITGNQFVDANFTYTLPANQSTNYVKVTSNKKVKGSQYEIRYFFPVQTDTGVFAPVTCYPDTNWICQNMGFAITTNNFPTAIRSDLASSREIK